MDFVIKIECFKTTCYPKLVKAYSKSEIYLIITYLETKSIAGTVCCCAAVRILTVYSGISGYPYKEKLVY